MTNCFIEVWGDSEEMTTESDKMSFSKNGCATIERLVLSQASNGSNHSRVAVQYAKRMVPLFALR